MSKWTYDPIGQGPFPSPATFTRQDSITLAVGANSISLRTPNIGDGRSLRALTTKVKLPNGEVDVHREPTWPKSIILDLGLSGLCDQTIADLQAFAKATVGQRITLTDWLGQEIYCVLLNPDLGLKRSDPNRHKVALTFRCEVD